MAINKVVIDTEDGQEVLMDVSQNTVTPETLAKGATATNAEGEQIVGTMEVDTPATAVLFTTQTLTDNQKKQARENISAVDVSEVSNYNMLVNSNFKNPVNQRGSSSWNTNADGISKYTIDRWYINSSDSTKATSNLSIGDKCLVFTGTPSETHANINLFQDVEDLVAGTYALSAKVNGNVYQVVLEFDGSSYVDHYFEEGVFLALSKKSFILSINLNVIPSANLEWAKLERGNKATAYVALTYHEEWLRCGLPDDSSEYGYKSIFDSFLKLSGGTLSGRIIYFSEGSGYVGLNNAGTLAFLTCRNVANDDTYLRQFEVATSKTSTLDYALVLRDIVNSSETLYRIFGEHNKPSGTYAGSGDATQRTISIGGIGSILTIYSNYGLMFATPYGTWRLSSTDSANTVAVSYLPPNLFKFENGVLTIATNEHHVNNSGVTYYWSL